ncbi:hypothetical protein LCGC14_0174470 [marine sediment metagenome]|uniref:Uncharacterized protein n=1 Tax=marine sediment metagenome TaxID=412755 RepID=A0A0F9XTG1_9ZZZZ
MTIAHRSKENKDDKLSISLEMLIEKRRELLEKTEIYEALVKQLNAHEHTDHCNINCVTKRKVIIIIDVIAQELLQLEHKKKGT